VVQLLFQLLLRLRQASPGLFLFSEAVRGFRELFLQSLLLCLKFLLLGMIITKGPSFSIKSSPQLGSFLAQFGILIIELFAQLGFFLLGSERLVGLLLQSASRPRFSSRSTSA